MIDKKKIILATQSASRVALVKQRKLDWECVKNTFNEDEYKGNLRILPNLQSVQNLTMDLAMHKAQSVVHNFPNSIVIGCDTVVLSMGKILEKPKTLVEAKSMLEYLQNIYQFVVTGVCLFDAQNKKQKLFCEVTKMKFFDFGENEYKHLLEEINPLENAGGYEYDEIIAPRTQIVRGSIENVIGIPINKIIKNLQDL